MKVVTKKEFRTLAFLLIAIFVLEFLFGGVSVQLKQASESVKHRQFAAAPWVNPDAAPGGPGSCAALEASSVGNAFLNPAQEAGIKSAHAFCKAIDEAAHGKGGHIVGGVTSCPVSGFTPPLAGLCAHDAKVACCAYDPSTVTAGGAISTFFGGDFTKALGQGLIISTAMGLVNQLIGGAMGGGGGSYTGDSGIQFRNEAEEQAYLQFSNDGLGAEVGIDAFSLAFGNGNTEEDTTTSLAYGTPVSTDTSTGASQKQPATEGDSVSTSYEQRRNTGQGNSSGDVAPIPGGNEFEQDFYGSSLSASDLEFSDGLSLVDLELGAQEELRRREALGNEQRGLEDSGGLRDYRSSNIAQSDSPVGLNPLSNTRYDDLEYEGEDKLSWWQTLILFIGKLLGATN